MRDLTISASTLNKKFRSPVQDLRYLLNRHYTKESAVKFVGDHYQLDRRSRVLLHRCIYSLEEAEEHKKKALSIQGVRGRLLAIDGYNTLITVESVFKGKPVIICDDGFIRDISEVHRKYRISKWTVKALKNISCLLSEIKISEAKMFFDKQISRSGELAALARKIFDEVSFCGDAEAVERSDTQAVQWSGYVASSDAVIIDKAEGVFDLAGTIAKRDSRNIFDIAQL